MSNAGPLFNLIRSGARLAEENSDYNRELRAHQFNVLAIQKKEVEEQIKKRDLADKLLADHTTRMASQDLKDEEYRKVSQSYLDKNRDALSSPEGVFKFNRQVSEILQLKGYVNEYLNRYPGEEDFAEHVNRLISNGMYTEARNRIKMNFDGKQARAQLEAVKRDELRVERDLLAERTALNEEQIKAQEQLQINAERRAGERLEKAASDVDLTIDPSDIVGSYESINKELTKAQFQGDTAKIKYINSQKAALDQLVSKETKQIERNAPITAARFVNSPMFNYTINDRGERVPTTAIEKVDILTKQSDTMASMGLIGVSEELNKRRARYDEEAKIEREDIQNKNRQNEIMSLIKEQIGSGLLTISGEDPKEDQDAIEALIKRYSFVGKDKEILSRAVMDYSRSVKQAKQAEKEYTNTANVVKSNLLTYFDSVGIPFDVKELRPSGASPVNFALRAGSTSYEALSSENDVKPGVSFIQGQDGSLNNLIFTVSKTDPESTGAVYNSSSLDLLELVNPVAFNDMVSNKVLGYKQLGEIDGPKRVKSLIDNTISYVNALKESSKIIDKDQQAIAERLDSGVESLKKEIYKKRTVRSRTVSVSILPNPGNFDRIVSQAYRMQMLATSLGLMVNEGND